MQKNIFSTISNIENIKPMYESIIDKKIHQIPCITSVTGTNFTNAHSAAFEWVNSDWLDLSTSYVNIKLRLTRPGDAVCDDTFTLNYNAGSCLFEKDNYQMNGITVGSCSDIPQAEAYYKRSHYSQIYNETVNSSSWCDSYAERVKRSSGKKAHEINWTPVSLAPFLSKNLIPPNNKHRLTLQIANLWQIKAIESALGTGANAKKHNNVQYPADFTIIIDDITFHAVGYEGGDIPKGQTLYYDFKNLITQSKSLNAQLKQSHHFSVVSNCYRIAMFMQTNNVTDTVNSVVRFKGRDGAVEREKLLSSYYMKIGQKNYPYPAALLDFGEANGGETVNVQKQYKDTLNNLLSYRNDAGGEDFEMWTDKYGPFYAHMLLRDVTQVVGILDLHLEFFEDPSTINVFLLQETSSILSITYNDFGMVVDTKMVEHGGVNA